jgi:hypothetical protein
MVLKRSAQIGAGQNSQRNGFHDQASISHRRRTNGRLRPVSSELWSTSLDAAAFETSPA